MVEAAPPVLAHDEHADRRGVGESLLVALEGGVIPAQVLGVQATAAVEDSTGCSWPEVELAGVAEVGAVGPGPDQQVRGTATGALGDVAHRGILIERAGEEDVVPAADVEGVGLNPAVEVRRPGSPVERRVERPCHRGECRSDHAARQVPEHTQGEISVQLAGRQLRRRLAVLGHGPGQGCGVAAVPPRQEVGADLELQPTEPVALVRAAASFLRLGVVVELRHARHHASQGGRLHRRGAPLGLRVV
jgi:hypothetical protein